jgi:hypothetical protein
MMAALHCATAKPVIQALVDENPRIGLEMFDVKYDPGALEVFR